MSLKPYKGLLIWLLLCSVTMAVRAEQPETTDLTNARDATALAAIQGLPPAIRNKIAPDLLKQFLEAEPEGGGAASGTLQPAKAAPITYLVFLRHRADLRGLNAIASKNDRRAAVVDRLKSAARRSQSELLDYLEERAAQGKIVRYKSYWVFNGLAVEGDLETALQLAKRPEVETIQPNRVYHLPEPQE
ncbi:MAG: protease inhibitor I9 family protein, partial [Chloroflexota bacterium]|nr:protease inhibitor I9 family protein [Chloroflexota bacterium]